MKEDGILSKPGDKSMVSDTDAKREKEIPPEFLYSYKLKSVPDRHGSVGTVDFGVDWRPEQIEIDYRYIYLTPNLPVFLDDHKRSFNKQLANGGRDMRGFSIPDPEIKNKRKILKVELSKERKALTEQLEKQIPIVRIDVKSYDSHKSYSGRDEDGKLSLETYYYLILNWDETIGHLPKHIAAITINTPDPRSGKDLELDQNYINALQKGNEAATAYLRQRLVELEAIESTPEIIAAKERLKTVSEELNLIDSTVNLDIPIYLAPEVMSDEERNQKIAEVQAKDPRSRLHTEYKIPSYRTAFNPLDRYGVLGTRKWYAERGIDLGAETIEFATSPKKL